MNEKKPEFDDGSRKRTIYCNRTLNLRAIKAIGYDMDYTLVHYNVDQWERCAFDHAKRILSQRGWSVDDLEFAPQTVARGLIVDTERGNLLKVNRYGYVKRAAHGTQLLDFDAKRNVYARTLVSLSDPGYVFLNTLFAISEACLFSQLVDHYDEGRLTGVHSYADVYRAVRATLDFAHMEGQLKADILADPERFIVLDDETPLALLDQKNAGKKLLLITNGEWSYARQIMSYAFDRFLPDEMTWNDLFDIVIVSAQKPRFFSAKMPVFEVVDKEGLLKPARALEPGRSYLGGHAGLVEDYLKISGDRILYVGDHIFGDARVSKSVLRWRTALVLRELEDEIAAVEKFRPQQDNLARSMATKERLEHDFSRLRLQRQRTAKRYGPQGEQSIDELDRAMREVRTDLVALDKEISVLARAAATLGSSVWGPTMRAGNDKSHFARQIERYADIYTSRVSNFLRDTPFAYFRSYRGSLPHDSPIKLNPLDDAGEVESDGSF